MKTACLVSAEIRTRMSHGIFKRSLITTFLFLVTLQGAHGSDFGPSPWLYIGLPVGVILFMVIIVGLQLLCPLCCLYKLRNSRGVVTYNSTSPVGVGGVVNPHRTVYPGTVIQTQTGMQQSGTVNMQGGQTVFQGAFRMQGGTQYPQMLHVPQHSQDLSATRNIQGETSNPHGTVFVQGGSQYSQGTFVIQSGLPYAQSTVFNPQHPQGAPPPYTPSK